MEHKHITGLPLSLVSPVDLGRVMRELDQLDNQLHEMQLRTAGQEVKMPKTTKMMDEILALNRLNLLLEEDRKTLRFFLKEIHDRAPRLHVSFSADPSILFVEKIMTWLRQEVHPVVLMTIGLQPNIGAGCVIRTTNKYFDLSLARDFAKKRDLLMQQLHDAPVQKPAVQAPTAQSSTPTADPTPAPASQPTMVTEGVAA